MLPAPYSSIQFISHPPLTLLAPHLSSGYHLGQHRLPPGKREVFQHDINVPFIVSGPGVPHNSINTHLAMNVDLAPTWAALGAALPAAHAAPVDGRSLVPLLKGLLPSQEDTEAGVAGAAGTASTSAPRSWRTFTLQEGFQSCEAGHGEGRACRGKPASVDARSGEVHMYPQLGKARDYSALRLKGYGGGRDGLYVEYTDGGRLYFDSATDPWQTNNTFDALSASEKHELAAVLSRVRNCKSAAQCP